MWKLFEHQDNGGIVSFITASSYLAGPGFVGMREVMRQTFDELWIVNLEGDNLGARKTDNVFAIQIPVAIAVGVRKGKPDRDTPAKVHYTKITGTRDDKLKILNAVENFAGLDWQDCPNSWQDRFLPQGTGDFFSWPALTDIFPWQHSGAQFKRRWPIGETVEVLQDRWKRFLSPGNAQRREAFYETRDRKIDKKYTNTLPGSEQTKLKDLTAKDHISEPVRYAFRSFDRQWSLFDTRLGDYLRPDLFSTHSNKQIYMHSLLTKQLGNGPSAVATNYIPDLDVFCVRGAKDIIPLWRDAEATQPNITNGLPDSLSKTLKRDIPPKDLFAYCYAVLAHPAYVEIFWEELSTPGPRIPVTKKKDLFDQAVELGRKLIWLHTYGERFAPKGKGDIPAGKAKCLKAIPDDESGYPEKISYDPVKKEIHFGDGVFGPVAPDVYEFEVSGLKVMQSWMAYRRKSGAGKRSSPLDEIRQRRWTAQMTDEFLELLWVLEHTAALFPDLKKLLKKIVSGPCFSAADLPQPAAAERDPPKTAAEPEHPSQGKLI